MITKRRGGVRRRCAFLAAVLTGVLGLSACSTDAPDPTDPEPSEPPAWIQTASALSGQPAGMQEVARTEALVLYADLSTLQFQLEDLRSGARYDSNPAGAEADEIAKSKQKREMASQLLIRYITDGKGTETSAASAADLSACRVQTLPDGFGVVYVFPECSIEIPVEYTLSEDGFCAKVAVSGIAEKANHSLTSLSLLPHFGAAGPQEEGYLFIPDGIGALIAFGEEHPYRVGQGSYTKPVYGTDPSRFQDSASLPTADIRLPVFGIKSGEQALFAVIENGETASVNAHKSGYETSYSNVYASFQYRASDIFVMGNSQSATPNYMYQTTPEFRGDFTVRYFPLSGEDANYSGMARRYNRYLQETTGMEKAYRPLRTVLELTGAVQVEWSVIGIPMKVVKTLTPFADAGALVESLGVDRLAVKYTGWSAENVRMKPASGATPLSALGGKKGLAGLQAQLAEREIPLYLDADLLYYEQSGGGLSLKGDSAKLISGLPAVQKSFLLSTLEENEELPWGYFTGIRHLTTLAEQAGDDLEALGAGVSLSSMGHTLYGDFTRPESTRQDTAAAFAQAAAGLQARGLSLMTSGGNAGLLGMVSAVTDAPCSYSGHPLLDEAVPFYPLALNGLAELSTVPVNRSADPDELLRLCAQTGMSPQFSLFTQNASVVKNTRYHTLYGSDAEAWAEDIRQADARLSALREAVGESFIYSHETIAPGITLTRYENGKRVVVNGSGEAYTFEGVSVAAGDWAVC